MSRELKIRLSDEQCDALAAEAKRNGLSYFDHCRVKLLEGLAEPLRIERVSDPMRPVTDQTDRLDRLEAMLAQLLQGGLPAQPEVAQQTQEAEVDVNDVIGNALGEADRQGLTTIQREEPRETSNGVRHVGTRRPSRYSVTPRHLQGL